jgi:hypothetical protein
MKTKIFVVSLLSAFCFLLCVLATETVPQTQTVLKSYFNPTGAIPTTNSYNELIDTMFWYIGDAWTNAQAAAASAAANPIGAAVALGVNNSLPPGTNSVNATHTNNFSHLTSYYDNPGGNDTWRFTNYFAIAFANNDYIVGQVHVSGHANAVFVVLEKTTTYCAFTYSGTTTSTRNVTNYVIFYR